MTQSCSPEQIAAAIMAAELDDLPKGFTPEEAAGRIVRALRHNGIGLVDIRAKGLADELVVKFDQPKTRTITLPPPPNPEQFIKTWWDEAASMNRMPDPADRVLLDRFREAIERDERKAQERKARDAMERLKQMTYDAAGPIPAISHPEDGGY